MTVKSIVVLAAVVFLVIIIVGIAPAFAQLPPDPEKLKENNGNQTIISEIATIYYLSNMYDGKKNSTSGEKIFVESIAGECCFSVMWVNDHKNGHEFKSVIPGLFSSGPLQKNGTWTHTFDRAGTYYYYSTLYPDYIFNVHIYNSATQCTPSGGCNNGEVHDSWCAKFGTIVNGTCINENDLNKRIQDENQRRKQVFEQRQNEVILKTSELESLKIQYQSVLDQWHAVEKLRYNMTEKDYMKIYNEAMNRVSPYEDSINKLSDEIRSLEQDGNVRFSCVADPVKLFTCGTETKTNIHQEFTDSTELENIVQNIQNQPIWLNKIFEWNEQGLLSDSEVVTILKYLIQNNVITG